MPSTWNVTTGVPLITSMESIFSLWVGEVTVVGTVVEVRTRLVSCVVDVVCPGFVVVV